MDIDPEEDNGLDQGAMEDDADDEYGLNPTQQKRKRRKKKVTTNEEDEAQDNATPSNLHRNDPGNFLKLCTALKILVGRSITEEDLKIADSLLRKYVWELVEVRRTTILTRVVSHLSYLALWSGRHQTQSPLCYTYTFECPKLWPAA